MPTQEIPTLKSQYAEKVTADLDLNTAEQGRIREEITSLQERLAGLEQDHELLVGMRSALGNNALAVPGPRSGKKPATAAPAATSTRKQAGAKAAATGSAKKATATKTSAAPKSTTAKSTAAKSAATKATATKSAETKAAAVAAEPKPAAAKQPAAKKPVAKKAAASDKNQVPLTELIHQHLTGQTEPKTAGEISQALAIAHPDRSLNDNLVRTSTERLVARSLAERAKQGSTVYYTATRPVAVAAEAPAVTADKAVAATTV